MGGCQSAPEEEIIEYPRQRRMRQPTEIVYARPQPRSMMRGYPMMMPYERRFPMAAPAIDGPMYGGGYRRFDDGYDDYDMFDRGRTRYSYHSHTR
jgi:hypothetical protein